MHFTRKQILDYLKTHHLASIPELSQALNLTIGNIRHHIKELEVQTIIEEVGNLPAKGRGRPTKMYCLSKSALDHNLGYLAEILLKLWVEGNPQADLSDRVHQIAKKMIGDRAPLANMIQRLNQAIEWLNQRHYRSRWEASPSGPRVILGYCPYLAILDTNPEMCQIDTSLVTQLIRTPMQPIAKLERSPQGSHQCVFVTGV